MLYYVIVIKIIFYGYEFSNFTKIGALKGFFLNLNLLIEIYLGEGFLVSQYVAKPVPRTELNFW